MSDYFIGEIRMFPFNWAPADWALCNGALLQVQQNAALFSLLSTHFGGNGQTTFGIPDLRGRAPLAASIINNTPYGIYNTGQAGGAESVTLDATQVPIHTHSFSALSAVGAATAPSGGLASTTKPVGTPAVTPSLYGQVSQSPSTPSALAPLNSGTINNVGGGAHNNMQPFLVMNFCIATTGLFPTRN